MTGPVGVDLDPGRCASSMASTMPTSSGDRLALHPQGHHEGGDLGRAGGAVEDLRHRRVGDVPSRSSPSISVPSTTGHPPCAAKEISHQRSPLFEAPGFAHRVHLSAARLAARSLAHPERRPAARWRGGVGGGCGGAPSRSRRPTRLPSPGPGGRTPGRCPARSTRRTPAWPPGLLVGGRVEDVRVESAAGRVAAPEEFHGSGGCSSCRGTGLGRSLRAAGAPMQTDLRDPGGWRYSPDSLRRRSAQTSSAGYRR